MNYKSFSSIVFAIPLMLLLNSCSESDTSTTDSQTDLVITDIYKKPGNPNAIYIKYMNLGNATAGDKFLIKLSSSKGSFEGNANHRFTVPAPNVETETGAYKVDLLSLANNETAKITAEIDWEGKSEESDETNNSFSKIVYGH